MGPLVDYACEEVIKIMPPQIQEIEAGKPDWFLQLMISRHF